MAVTHSLFRNISAHTSKPHFIMSALNKALADGNDNNMFVTIFIGVLDLGNGHLCYCNAGHDEPLLIGEHVDLLPCDPNLPVGIMPEWEFSLQEMDIAPKTTIFLYTDGLTEAEDGSHAQFDLQRVVDKASSLVAEGKNQPTVIVNEMTEAVGAFVGDATQSDDLTMLAINYKKSDETKG